MLYVGQDPVNFVDPEGKSTIGAAKKALKEVYEYVGGRITKRGESKFGSSMRGDSIKGYRLDPPHYGSPPGSPESYPHINWWDYTEGKMKSGKGRKGAVPLKEGLLGFIGSLLDPFDVIAGELGDGALYHDEYGNLVDSEGNVLVHFGPTRAAASYNNVISSCSLSAK
jgi:hypothetical protein